MPENPNYLEAVESDQPDLSNKVSGEDKKTASDKGDAELLKRIRERYTYARKAWADIWDEGDKDMNYISGDPWDEDDKEEREDAGRPCLSMDELGQYCNQYINGIRQNEPGIKVDPSGEEATDETAELHQDLIRTIEYESNAQRNAYIPAAENAAQRGYGFFRIGREYIKGKFDQKITIKGIANPNTVIYDPDVSEADWSDAKFCFIAVPIGKEEFKRKYPEARKTDFSHEDLSAFPEWIREDHIVEAEYWEVEVTQRKLLLFKGPEGNFTMYEDELPEGIKASHATAERMEETRSIKKYITNGVEILEKAEEPGTHIPIVPVIGKEMWIRTGGRTKRVIMSLVRLARDPQMAYNYYASQAAEEAGLSPKAIYKGYKGQFESSREVWKVINKVPYAFVEADIVVDGATQQVLPLPIRETFTPNFPAYSAALDWCRRAVMSAMGLSPAPTAAQRSNEKSGVALERLESQESIGSFHFTDNLHRSLELAGRILEEWIPEVYDTMRVQGLRKADGTHLMARLNTPEPYADPRNPQNMLHFPVDKGDHSIRVSVGPSMKSQREDAADFLDTLLKVLPTLPLAQPQMAELLALGLQMRNLGPLGDQMVQIIRGDPAQAQGQQAIQQLQLAQANIQQLQGEMQKLLLEKHGKVVEHQFKAEIVKLQEQARVEIVKFQETTKLAVAQMNSSKDSAQAIADGEIDKYQLLATQAHERAMQSLDHAHESALSAQEHQQGLAAGQQSADLAALNKLPEDEGGNGGTPAPAEPPQ